MSQELSQIRRALTRVSTDVKQGQLISAATSIKDAARIINRIPLMKNELDELVTLIQSGCELLRYNKELAKIFPLSINYAAGQEPALVELMNQLIETLQESSTEEAIQQHAKKKQEGLDKGRHELNEGQHEQARQTFNDLTNEYDDDGQLATEVGESFLQAGLFEDASNHLGKAAVLSPDSAHVFNRLAVALRKMKRFDAAEEHFLKALELGNDDSNLHFNMGRLYFDWQKWPETLKCAEQALKLNPDFTEAKKLADYAKRKIDES